MIVDRLNLPLDHGQNRSDQPARVGRGQQDVRPGLLVLHHDHQAPELHRRVGLGFGSGGNDAVPKGDGPGPRVLTLPADLGPLDRGAALRPGGVQALEIDQAVDEPVFEGGEGFGGAGHVGGGMAEMRSGGPYVVPKTQNPPLIEP